MMRKEILKAAVSCDYQLLQALALRPQGSFQYSREEESAGPKPSQVRSGGPKRRRATSRWPSWSAC